MYRYMQYTLTHAVPPYAQEIHRKPLAAARKHIYDQLSIYYVFFIYILYMR